MNRLEIFNELCILCSSYTLFLFTDFLSIEQKERFDRNDGFILMGLGIGNILVNMFIIVKKSFKDLKAALMKAYNKCIVE